MTETQTIVTTRIPLVDLDEEDVERTTEAGAQGVVTYRNDCGQMHVVFPNGAFFIFGPEDDPSTFEIEEVSIA